jgi:hypothetical protein
MGSLGVRLTCLLIAALVVGEAVRGFFVSLAAGLSPDYSCLPLFYDLLVS